MPVMSDVLLTTLLLGLVALGSWRVARLYLRFRGTRIIGCPGTGQSAAVKLAAWRIAVTPGFSEPKLRLVDCSRWRERERCNRACLQDIEAAPEECLVATILSKWYEAKACACCGKTLTRIDPWRHKPCVMSPDLRLVEWRNVPAEDIPRILATHSPVCWECLVAETHTF